MKFKGVMPCGCVTWLYSGEYDTPKQRERALIKAMKDGLRIVPLRTEDEVEQARTEWSDCPHSPKYGDLQEEARALLGTS